MKKPIDTSSRSTAADTGSRSAPSRAPWTKREEAILRRYYPTHDSVDVAELLGRTPAAVQHRAHRLGIDDTSIRAWTEAEERYLRKNYGKRTAQQIAQTLRRTESSVRGKVHTLQLGIDVRLEWTDEEIAYLRAHYGRATIAELAEELGRSHCAVQLKGSKLGLSRKVPKMTPVQAAWARKQLGHLSYPDIADRLGVPASQVQAVALKAGHRPRAHMRSWTRKEDDFLRKHYGTMPRREICDRLDRSIHMISWRAGKLGLVEPRSTPMREWTPKEDAFATRNYGTMPTGRIAEKLGRTELAVAARVRALRRRERSG